MIESQTAHLVVGVLLVVFSATAWTLLHPRDDRSAVSLWCAGSLVHGLGLMLLGLQDVAPAWLASVVAIPLTFTAYPLHALALRRELIDGERHGPVVAACLVMAALGIVAYLAAPTARVAHGVALSANLAGAACLAWLAWQIRRRTGFRSAAVLAAGYGLFVCALGWRLGQSLATWHGAPVPAGQIDMAGAVLPVLVVAVCGNLGYLGLALDTARGRAGAHQADLAQERSHRARTDLRMAEQAILLAERGRLLSEREEMLAALAHEVRQPLNNASAALQSASQALLEDHFDREQASARLKRAKSVLIQVTSALDNTLADAVLLGGSAPLARQDIDVDTIVSLAIADVDPSARHRVLRARDTDARTASMNAGLVRLALRNLIANALAYAPADSPVTVRIAESDEPLALLIDVCDQGAGIPAELLPRLFTRGARGDHVHNPRGHGLGLYIVRRIMEMHGGTAEVHPAATSGLTMRLVIPQSFAS